MTLYTLYYTSVCYDLAVKFNCKALHEIPTIEKSVFCMNDKFREQDPFRGVPIISSLPMFRSGVGKPTFIKQASSGFRTRQGDVHGFKLLIKGKDVFVLLFDFFSVLSTELFAIGLKPNFGISRTGVITFSLPETKLHPFFKDSATAFFTMAVGGDLSVVFKHKQSTAMTAVYFSAFKKLPFNKV